MTNAVICLRPQEREWLHLIFLFWSCYQWSSWWCHWVIGIPFNLLSLLQVDPCLLTYTWGDINIGGDIDLEACTQSNIQLSGGGLTNHHKSVSGWEHQGWCEHPSEINQRDLMQPSPPLFQEFVQFSQCSDCTASRCVAQVWLQFLSETQQMRALWRSD